MKRIAPSFIGGERMRAAAWKRWTRTLPDAAREPARYIDKDGKTLGGLSDHCLPVEHAALSLLPEVRERALAIFAELGIPWHAGVDGGPSNNLLSSQVQCVNALGQMVTDPDLLVRAFADELGVVEALPIEPERYLTFEYIGPTDFFGEVPDGERVRGARCTSIDAAFLHRTSDGLVELVLIEWKYTEAYDRPRTPDPAKDAVRWQRYGDALTAPDGPVRCDVLPFADLLDEPFYQLVRQQLLAYELEKAHAHGADRVRVVHVLPKRNLAYRQSLRPAHRALGGSVSEVWQQLLRTPDRFVPVDSALFDDPEITSDAYVSRYQDDHVADREDLLRLCRGDVEDHLYCTADYDGDVMVEDEEVVLLVARLGAPLAYPFSLSELCEFALEHEREAWALAEAEEAEEADEDEPAPDPPSPDDPGHVNGSLIDKPDPFRTEKR